MSWQPTLVDRGPTRRVRALGTSWWGVDPSTQRVSIAVAERRGEEPLPITVQTVSFARIDGAARLSTIYGDCKTLAAVLASTQPPGLVVVEQPSGTHVNVPLVEAVGCAIAGIYDGVLDETGAPARFEPLNSMTWKKDVLGYGAIKKPDREAVRRGEQYAVLEWAAATQGYQGASWDEADAMAMAAWARQDVLLES